MPISSYYGGHGKKVFSRMVRQYGRAKGEEVFYATSNARKKHKRRVRRRSSTGS